jgi:hypothetical protein
MPACAALAIAITISTITPGPHPAFQAAEFDMVTADTSPSLQGQVTVTKRGDIYFNFNGYPQCVTVKFTLSDPQLQFGAHSLKTARSNIDPFKEPAANDPDFQNVTEGFRAEARRHKHRRKRFAAASALSFDWISSIPDTEYRLYRLDLSPKGAGHGASIDPKISNSGVN